VLPALPTVAEAAAAAAGEAAVVAAAAAMVGPHFRIVVIHWIIVVFAIRCATEAIVLQCAAHLDSQK
jgi:hypothetical protein